MRRTLTNLCLTTLAFAVLSSLGSAPAEAEKWKLVKKLDPRRAIGMKKDEPAEPQIPTRMVATWVDATLQKPGQRPVRGFGGRIVFFNSDGDDSVRVAGQLVVYAFDETDRASYETQPTRRFVFRAEQFVKHESPSQFGPSYSVWLPWDEVGGPQKNISLIARFEPQGGAMIIGEQTAHLLPGIVRPKPAITESSPPAGDVQLATFADGGDAGGGPAQLPAAQGGRNTTTIDLPIGLAAKLARRSQGQAAPGPNRTRPADATRLTPPAAQSMLPPRPMQNQPATLPPEGMPTTGAIPRSEVGLPASGSQIFGHDPLGWNTQPGQTTGRRPAGQ